MKIGKKIVVIGTSAVGKSTFSKKLSKKNGIPVVFVDSIMWKSGWNYSGDEEIIKKLDEESKKSEWIIEGFIHKGARGFIFDRADTIIYLDYHSLVSSSRYITRWLKHHKTARPELEGSPDKFSFKFLKLIWKKGEVYSLNKFLLENLQEEKIIKLTSPSKTKRFLNSL